MQYLIVEKIMLQGDECDYFKDDVVTADDVGKDNIERYLRLGYIKPLEQPSKNKPPPNFKKPPKEGGDA